MLHVYVCRERGMGISVSRNEKARKGRAWMWAHEELDLGSRRVLVNE